MAIKIRPPTGRDKPAIMDIVSTTPEFDEMDRVVAEELVDAYLADGTESGYHILVAEADARVSGYVCYGPTPLTEGTWDVYWLAVAREKHGKGIGTALLTAAESNIKKAKGRMILIETESHTSYEKTQQFYFKRGYTVVCNIPDFYKGGHGKLVYQKLL